MSYQKMTVRVLGIIPARLASTRFPGKLLQKIDGKPLIQHTFENAIKCKRLDEVLIATDSKDIADIAQDFGAQVIMTSDRCNNGTERIIEALKRDDYLKTFDIIVNIQGDEPLLEHVVIESVINTLQFDSSAAVSSAVCRLEDEKELLSPSVVKCVFDENHHALYFSRSLIPGNKTATVDPSIDYYKHLGIYAYRINFLPEYAKMEQTPLQQAEDLEQLKILERGYNLKVAIVNSQSLGVDTPEDLKKVEKIICKRNISSSQAESARP